VTAKRRILPRLVVSVLVYPRAAQGLTKKFERKLILVLERRMRMISRRRKRWDVGGCKY
jgi:hypothetical protein